MSKTFSINGFGRIGRAALRIWWNKHQNELDLVAVNTSGSMPLEGWVYLLKYDTNYGIFDPGISFEVHQSNQEVSDQDPLLGIVKIGNKEIKFTAQRQPAKLPWKEYGVDYVLEATGAFRKEEGARQHLEAGAKKVMISAPAKSGGFSTSVMGVTDFEPESELLSNASCTTNCVAPVAQILHSEIGVKKATLTTIHAYTDSQNILDNSHKKDLRRARAAAENLIPTSTGAAKATTEIIPELQGLFDGMAVRVPIPTGSLSDLTFVTSRATSVKEVNQLFRQAAQSERWQGTLAVTDEPIVSSDIVGRPEASIVDLSLTQVIDGDLVKVISWYDNEWGYCAQMLRQMIRLDN
ncbi:MAG: type I glyceraldehyde-3-phosphate dehydrogenase [Candidatus Pacebacteria bacterium]|nr:type I glyceraldehyde-3-phosphate dehydrogenase [Candidatus Paceibacterota bacterium]